MTTEHGLPDDDATRALARVLHAEVDDLEVSGDSLARIRARTTAGGGRTSWRWIAPLSAAAVVAVIATGVVLLPDGGSPTATPGTPPSTTPSITASPSASSVPASPSESSNPSPTPTGSACAEPTATTGVYYVQDVPQTGPRLFREFTKVGTCADPITEAVTQMLQNQPADPDYASLWPEGTQVLSVSRSARTATVDLSAFVTVGAAFESASVQQLVWTVTAADRSIRSVRLLVNGATPPSGHSDWSAPITRGNALDTLAWVWILQPTQQANVTSPVRVRVYGTGFEGNVVLKVFQGSTVVATTNVTTMMGGFAEASTTITLPAGSYVLKSYTDNGRDATLQLWDSKDFTVG